MINELTESSSLKLSIIYRLPRLYESHYLISK